MTYAPFPGRPAAVPGPAGRRGATRPIRWHLLVFAALVLLPQIALGLCVGWWYSAAEHRRMEASAVAAAATLGDQLDHELAAMKAALQALATSPNARTEDFRALREQALQLPTARGAMVAIRDRDRNQVMNTLVPPGQALPRNLDPVLGAADRRVFETGGTTVSDLFTASVTKSARVAVLVPITIDEAPRYVMSAVIAPRVVQDILMRTRMPTDWTLTVLDGNDRVVARSREQSRFLGRTAPPAFTAAVGGRASGTVPDVVGFDGRRHFTTFHMLDAAGWRVVVSVPHEVLNAPFRVLVITLLAVAFLALATSLLLAHVYARRLEREITSLEAMAAATGSGRMAARPPGRVRELEAIAAALRTTDASLLERNRTRDLLLAELNHRVRNTLSVLLSVVNHTVRSSGDDALARKTSGRIMALSRAHDLLSHAEWSPVALSALVHRTGEEEGLPLGYEGPEILLRAEAVAPMAQVLHELTVNQRRHGRERGRPAFLRTAIEPDGVRLTWVLPDAGGRRPCLPGFGLRLVRMCLERQLFGRIERLDAEGLEAVLPPAFLVGEGLPTEPFAARWRAGLAD